MSVLIRGRHPNRILLPTQEVAALTRLHQTDGAWTVPEMQSHLDVERYRQLVRLDILRCISTDIGPLILLTMNGQVAVFGNLKGSVSLITQQNRAYFRLALAHLSWSLPAPGGWSRGLEDYAKAAKAGQFREVVTPQGNVLAAAKLTADGFSRKHYGRVVQRLKSAALSQDFEVYLITPNARRNHKLIERASSFLHVIQFRPELPEGAAQLIRAIRPSPHQKPPAPGPYLAGEAWRTDPRFRSLPTSVQNILQKTREERIAAALRSIEVDGVMSAAQLRSFYALEPADIPGVLRVETHLRTTPTQPASEQEVTFLTLSRRLARLDDHRLAHRCGTGRMRHLLNVPADPERWKAEHRGRLKLEEPDALYTSSKSIEIAIEYDAGTYRPATIERKLTTFNDRGFKIVWGVSNPVRQRKLAAEIGASLCHDVLLAEWWT